MTEEGNFITKYWLKRYNWYDPRFLITLPLFIIYMYVLAGCMIVLLIIEFILFLLTKTTNIKHFKLKIIGWDKE